MNVNKIIFDENISSKYGSILTVEKYNGTDNLLVTENLKLDKNIKIELFTFIQNCYKELVADKNINDIISDILLKLIELTNSKDGYISLVTKKDNEILLTYFCVYLDIGGFSIRPQMQDCTINVSNDSLLTYSIKNKCIVISNKLTTDPRAKNTKISNSHPLIETYIGIPLIDKSGNGSDQIIGQIGLSNNKQGYTSDLLSELLLLIDCCGQFVWFYTNKDSLIINKNVQLKQEIGSLKGLFITTMSHEIRTPLNGIVGMARLLTDSDGLNIKQREYIRILNECSVQLLELVNDILDYSKISAGTLSLINGPFNLKECIESTIDIVAQRATDKKIDLIKVIPDNLPQIVNGDIRRLKQILINLLNNAIKFTDRGYVKLTIDYQELDNTTVTTLLEPKKYNIVFNIKDTGRGIKLQDQERIFDVFTKLIKDDATEDTDVTPGAGLGLAISKQLVELMNGHISITSDGKTGSTFTFNILLEDDTNINNLLLVNKEILKGKKILIVDDREDNRIYLMENIHKWGMNCYSFSSARETLTFASLFQDFDLAIIDIFMPNMNGIELVQHIRQMGLKQPVIGLSSIGSDLQGKEWFDQFEVKPINKGSLLNLILRCFLFPKKNVENNSLKNIQKKNDNGNCGSGTKILIAEDDYYNSLLLTEMLSTLGYTNTFSVTNGNMCVEEIKKNQENDPYDICFMDIKMPIMDGLDATRIIKQTCSGSRPFIVAVSASVTETDKARCFNAGMDAYIPKPIQKEQLITIMETIVNNF